MIRRTLSATQEATYSVDLPDKNNRDLPSPTGTGFFVSPDGWFVTAAHVVCESGEARRDVERGWLMKESRPGEFTSGMCQDLTLAFIDQELDFALLKVDWERNRQKEHLKGRVGFPHLTVADRSLSEGEPVYSFGYPLSGAEILVANENMTIAHSAHSPRTTSAIVASTMEHTMLCHSAADPQVYVLDKALNYGNSGGPIVATDTGLVHAFCSRFQPVRIRQPHLFDTNGNPLFVMIPSLYGVVVSLGNSRILVELKKKGVPIS